ncbi:MAG: hypothetical protein E6J46_05150 [Chloroflexi bacterium]|nr:MAG: hypothetical protein E6J46_05150 [Chloroflexota bacterium]
MRELTDERSSSQADAGCINQEVENNAERQAVVATLSASHGSSATVSAPATGSEQIAHNRSEAGLGASWSIGAEQIAHNRSEAGLAGR